MASTAAHLNPRALRWARESIGYTLDIAAGKIKVRPEKLRGAERGDLLLTLRQAEKAAEVYERPLVDLFRPEAPQEEPDEAKFRRLPGAPELPWPPEMKALVRRIRKRQDAAAELYELLDEQPVWLTVEQLPGSEDPETAAVAARTLLGVSVDEQRAWQDRDGYTGLRIWIDAIEDLGVLVMQDGSLPLETMRGFASTHSAVPAILINTKDDPRARAFTLVHEFGHLLPGSAPHGGAGEIWCNRFAAQLLMPAVPFKAIAAEFSLSRLEGFERLAHEWGTTPLATVVRARTLGLISEQISMDLVRELKARAPKQRRGGGTYYRNKVAWLGPSYINLVFEALDLQAVTYPTASTLLDAKVNHFYKLREQAQERSAG